MKLLVAYATAHGSTAEIARMMQDLLIKQGHTVELAPIEQVQSIEEFDACIFGTPIHNGLWLPAMTHFVYNRRDELSHKPLYFWITCIRVLEAGGYEHVQEHYLRPDTLAKLGVRHAAAFAGKLALEEVDFNERWSLSVRYDGLKTADNFNGDYRNWNKIRTWLEEVCIDLRMIASHSQNS